MYQQRSFRVLAQVLLVVAIGVIPVSWSQAASPTSTVYLPLIRNPIQTTFVFSTPNIGPAAQQPRLGDLLFYANIYTLSPGRTPKLAFERVDDTSPWNLSPDGRFLAINRRIFDRATGNTAVLEGNSSLVYFSFFWRPDSQRILYSEDDAAGLCGMYLLPTLMALAATRS